MCIRDRYSTGLGSHTPPALMPLAAHMGRKWLCGCLDTHSTLLTHTRAHTHTHTHTHARTRTHARTHTHTHTLLFGSVCAHLSAGRMSEWGQLQYSIMQKLMGNTYVLTKHLERRPASHTQNQTSTKLPSYQEHTAYDEN